MRGLNKGLPSASIATRFSVRTTKGRTRSLVTLLSPGKESRSISCISPMELVGLALMRRRRQEKDVGAASANAAPSL